MLCFCPWFAGNTYLSRRSRGVDVVPVTGKRRLTFTSSTDTFDLPFAGNGLAYTVAFQIGKTTESRFELGAQLGHNCAGAVNVYEIVMFSWVGRQII